MRLPLLLATPRRGRRGRASGSAGPPPMPRRRRAIGRHSAIGMACSNVAVRCFFLDVWPVSGSVKVFCLHSAPGGSTRRIRDSAATAAQHGHSTRWHMKFEIGTKHRLLQSQWTQIVRPCLVYLKTKKVFKIHCHIES